MWVKKKPAFLGRKRALTNKTTTKWVLERNIVIHIREVRRWTWGWAWCWCRCRHLWARGRCRTWGWGFVAAATAVAVAVVHAGVAAWAGTSAQHLHVFSDDVGRVFLDAIFVGVFTRLQAAFDVDRRAFFQVLADDFRQAAEERNTMPFGQLFLLTGVAVFRFVRGR